MSEVPGSEHSVKELQVKDAPGQADNLRRIDRLKRETARDGLVKAHMVWYESLKPLNIQGSGFIPRHFDLPPPYLPSLTPLEELKKLYIDDLSPGTHHRGSYILLRAITPSIRMAVTITIVEDENEDVFTFHFYHLEEGAYPTAGNIQEGGVCIIKEPWIVLSRDGAYVVRVDHISDVIWLPKADSRRPLAWQPRENFTIKTAKQWKDNGNDAMRAGELHEAAECYTSALQAGTTSEEIQVIKLNRSLAHLKLKSFDKALEDAGGYSVEARKSEKALYRTARAMYELGRFKESQNVLTALLAQYPGSEAAIRELRRVSKRIQEQDHGLFDFLAMQKAAAQESPPCLDVATYVGPVEICETENRGRGLFTTKDVAAGDLLLCEKAFSYSFLGNASTMSVMDGSTLKGTKLALVEPMIHKLHRNPSLIPSITTLHHGTYKPAKHKIVDGTPIIDTFLIDRVLSLNVFESSRASILARFGRVGIPDAKREKREHACGLYVKASYVNHSCYSNARRSFIGDVLILRATRNIPAGQEISFWYASPKADHNFDTTQKKLQNWDFQCSCDICSHDRETPNNNKKKRAALLKEWDVAAKHVVGETGLTNIESLLAAIEQTYTAPAAMAPRLALWDPYLALTRVYVSNEGPERTITAAWKVLTALGFVVKRDSSSIISLFEVEQWGLMVDPLIETWVHLWLSYGLLRPRQPMLSARAEQYAKITYRICIGEDESFEEKLGSVARRILNRGGDLGMAFTSLSMDR